MFKFIDDIRMGMYHATYHRNLKKAEAAQKVKNITAFQKFVYKAEDAWRKLVTIRNKYEKGTQWENEDTKATHQET